MAPPYRGDAGPTRLAGTASLVQVSRIVMVRHGQSTWNRRGRIQGQTMGVPLTLLGRRQAARAARQVRELVSPGTPVIVSDQRRARQTARPIARALRVCPILDPRLREQGLGEMEGRVAADLDPIPVPDGVDVADVRWGGGESLADVADRCRSLLADLAAEGSGDVVLVTHGDTLRVLLGVLDGRSHRDLDWDLPLTNGIVVVRDVTPPGNGS